MADYDVSKAYKRIENELIDSMIRNFKRHRVDEMKEGFTWEQWQVLQLRELEKYRLANPKKFAGDFSEIEKRAGDALMTTYTDAKSAEEAKILKQIAKGKIRQTRGSGTVAGKFFGLNAGRVEHLIEATKADFGRGSWSMLRQANDQYRKIIFDAQMYSATGATYEQAVDMATKDFLKNGIQSIVYKNGSHHGMEEYSRMALKTGQKRAYLMGEGDVHDKYGIHTVRVNKRVDACPLCVKWLGKVLIDDVYAGGTLEEAQQAKVPLLSEAIDEGFLHPNCKDVYSMYVEGISQPAEPWTKEEMQDIADRYNSEQALKRAEDMRDSYQRMADNSLDPANVDRYKARADAWGNRVDQISAGMPPPPITPVQPPAPPVEAVKPFTSDELEALEWYVSGDGMWINQYMRGRGSKELLETPLSDNEKRLLENLKTATSRPLEDVGTLYRSVDAESILGELSADKMELLNRLYSEDKAVQKDITSLFDNAKGKTITEKGFMSTTTDKELAVYWEDYTGSQNPVVLEINTEGKAVKGAKIPKELEVAEDPQNEILLSANTKYKVKSATIETAEDGTKYINVKVDIVDDVAETAEVVKKDLSVALSECTTVDEVETLMQQQEWFYVNGKGYDGNALVSLAGSDIDGAKAIFEAHRMVFDKFPQLKGKLIPPRVSKLGTGTYAQCYMGLGRGGLSVNSRYFGNYAKVVKGYERDVKAGFHTAGTDPVSIIVHELGHAIDDYLTHTAKVTGNRKKWASAELRPKVARALKIKVKDFRTEVSEYATKNSREWWAESFAEYICSKSPRRASAEFGRMFEEMIKAVK